MHGHITVFAWLPTYSCIGSDERVIVFGASSRGCKSFPILRTHHTYTLELIRLHMSSHTHKFGPTPIFHCPPYNEVPMYRPVPSMPICRALLPTICFLAGMVGYMHMHISARAQNRHKAGSMHEWISLLITKTIRKTT